MTARGLLMAALFLAGSGCAAWPRRLSGGSPVWIVVEGWSRDDPAHPAEAESRALLDARREAVAEAVRLYLPPRELAARSESLSAGLLAHPSAYIAGEKETAVRREGGWVKLSLRAGVLFQKIAADLEALGLLRPEDVLGVKLGLALPDAAARSAVKGVFEESGFSVVAESSGAFLTDDRPGDLENAVHWGRRAGVDAVVAGRAGALPERNSASYRARVELTLTDPRNSRLLAGAFQEASAAGSGPEAARAQATLAAGRLAAGELERLSVRFLDRTDRLELKIGLPGAPEDVRRFEASLRAMPRVRGVRLEEYSRSRARLIVRGEGLAAGELAAAIRRLPDCVFDVRSATPEGVQLARRDKQ